MQDFRINVPDNDERWYLLHLLGTKVTCVIMHTPTSLNLEWVINFSRLKDICVVMRAHSDLIWIGTCLHNIFHECGEVWISNQILRVFVC